MQTAKYPTNNLIVLFFLFICLFPSLRQLTIGSETATNPFEFFIAALPDIFLIGIVLLACIQIKQSKSITWHLFDKLLIAFILYNIIVGTLIAGDLKASLYAIRMTYLPMSLYFLVSFSIFKFPKWERVLEKLFQLIVCIGLIGILLYFVFPKVQLYFLEHTSNKEIQSYFIIRMTSIFWTPVVFGVCISAAVLYWFYRYILVPKRVFLIYLGILFICLFLSVSRGPMIALTLGTLTLGCLFGNYKRLLHVILLEIGVFILVGFYISNPIEFAYWIISSSADTIGLKAGVSRVELWRKSFESILKQPFGLGLGKAGHTASRFYSETDKTASVNSTDGWYLKLMLETGFFGLLFYVSICVIFVRKVIQYIRTHEADVILFIFVFVGVVNVINLVSNVLDFFIFSHLFWLIMGIFVLKLKETKHV